MEQHLYEPVHEEFRSLCRQFLAREAVPYHDEWSKAGIVDRAVWRKAGAAGLLGMDVPEEYGGGGQRDFRYNAVLAGEIVTAIAMSEPGAGSDLAGIRTTAVRDGDSYVLNGQKTFITNGENADLVIVVAKTDPTRGAHGVSLIAVERGTPGFSRGRRLEKVGLKANDTAELFFADCRVPADEHILAFTLEYARSREAFGRPIGSFQHNRFLLAELDTEVTIARTFLNHCITEYNAGRLTVADAAKAKWWTTELQTRIADRSVQLHGGYGYTLEYPVARAWLDSRVQTIYGGTTEIMKEIIGRSLGL